MKDATGGRPFGAGFPASQQISWWDVHQFVQALDLPEALPFPGTPAWQHASDAVKALACIAGKSGLAVDAGDGAALTEEEAVTLDRADDAEVLVFDLA